MFGIRSAGDARARAIYAADSWQVTDQLRIDLGARYESIDIDYVLDTGPGFPNGTTDLIASPDGKEWAYTAAVNYDVTGDLGLFGRYTHGFLFPHFDDIREGAVNIDGVDQTEAGVKFRGDNIDLYATAFYNTNDAFNSVVGSTVPGAAFTTRAFGLEIDGAVHLGSFSTGVIATFQDTEITDSTTAANVGNQVLRQPNWQLRISPAYTADIGGMDATLYAGVTFVGDRFGDNANTVQLDGYEKIDLGVMIEHPSGLFFQVAADNLTDSDGLTEGDPRSPTSPNGRPIFGRSILMSVGYDF